MTIKQDITARRPTSRAPPRRQHSKGGALCPPWRAELAPSAISGYLLTETIQEKPFNYEAMPAPSTFVIMGVCGSGKSAVGGDLAALLGGRFDDADDFHSPEAREKMRGGTPLTDEDRLPWLRRLRQRIMEMRATFPGSTHVLACSALRAAYREILRGEDSDAELRIVLLDGSRELIASRLAERKGHYMPPALLDSQFSILERTPDLLAVPIEASPREIARSIVKAAQA
jgi:gluconokinase